MIKFQEKRVQRIQLSDITINFLCEFYNDESEYNTALMIFDGDEYLTNITLEEIWRYSEERELMCFLKYFCKGKELKSCTNISEEAALVFKKNPDFVWILVKDTLEMDKALFVSDYATDIKKYSEIMVSVRDILQSKGIHIFLVKIPAYEDILVEKRHPEWKLFNFSTKMNWTVPRRQEMEKYLYKFTDFGYEKARADMCKRQIQNTKIGDGKRTIFLVGPCIVGGIENCLGETLAEILSDRLGADLSGYQVQKVITSIDIKSKYAIILENDIKRNDIVIWIDSYIGSDVPVDLDLTDVYNHYEGDRWLYSDVPIHTTKTGNEIIADTLVSNIIRPVVCLSDERNDHVVSHVGEGQLTCEEEYVIYQYLEDVKQETGKVNGKTGACVMTCNPFTKGHFYLIEYASKMVDFLYVFIVEEDAFYFSFDDRIEMVRKGTACFDNVAVLPSGRFMISRETFKNYFEKEIFQNTVIDATKDIMIFKNYVVPVLGISKRFVGSEPEDRITAQYNQALKADLGFLVEIVEISRKEVSGEVISASRARKYLKNHNWQMLDTLVPCTTLEHIRANLKRIMDRDIGEKLPENIDKIIQFIRTHQNIVICGLGQDSKKLMSQLEQYMEAKDVERLDYYDKKMAYRGEYYKGKRVIGFQELISYYRDYYMIIATSRFKMDLLYDLAENEINPDHIVFL